MHYLSTMLDAETFKKKFGGGGGGEGYLRLDTAAILQHDQFLLKAATEETLPVMSFR